MRAGQAVMRFPLLSALVLLCLSPGETGASPDILRVEAGRLGGNGRTAITIDARKGIGPDEAAVIAVLMSPALKTIRDKRGDARAQLIQAGVLPNPQVSYERDAITGGATQGTQPEFSFNATWEVTSLLPLMPRRAAARANARAVDLQIAWEEWQAAANSKLAVYRVAALQEELDKALDADKALHDTVITLRKAVAVHEKTLLDLAATESASEEAHATMLELDQERAKQWLALKRTLGLEPTDGLRLRKGILLPVHLSVADEAALSAGVQNHRIDLIGLRQGIASQDETVRAAVLAAFPKITAGFLRSTDNTDVHMRGFTVQMDVPFFDRNQGVVATERATRQTLEDEYAQRLFEARNDIASAVSDVRAYNSQIAAAQEALPLLERLTNVAQSALNTGNGDVLSYYTAVSDLLQKRLQLVKLQEQLMESITDLELASGQMEISK